MKRNNNGNGTYVKLYNGNWQCRILCKMKTVEGKNKIATGSAKTKEESFKIANRRKKQWDRMRELNKSINKKNNTLKELFSKWLVDYSIYHNWSGRTSYTIKSRVNSMVYKHRISNIKVNTITVQMIDFFFSYLINNYCRKSVSTIFNLFKDFFADMKSQCIVDNNIMLDARRLNYHKKVVEHKQCEKTNFKVKLKIFNESEIIKLIDYIKLEKNKEYIYYASIFILLFYTGMRGQEIRALTVDDIDFTKHTIKINKSLSTNIDNKTIWKKPKTTTSIRTIAINKATEELIKNILKNRPNKSCKYIICNKHGKWISYNCFLKKFNLILDRCGIEKKGRSPHSMRHTFISFSIEQNKLSPLYNKSSIFISRYVGHANLSITQQVYTHISDDKLKDIEYNNLDVLELEFY